MNKFNGLALFLDRSDINTDEIIPAKYLTEISKEALKSHILEDLSLDDFNPSVDTQNKGIIITRENFGCGSSREHAAWVLEVNGIGVVIGESFARIFRQNMFNCGLMAIELPKEIIDEIFALKSQNPSFDIDIENSTINVKTNSIEKSFSFEISKFDDALVKAGGWLEYADQNY